MKPYWLLLAAMICVFAPGCSGGGETPEDAAATEAEDNAELSEDEEAMEEDAESEGEGGGDEE